MSHPLSETTLFINLQHLTHNFHYLKSKLHPDTKFLGVVKAFAYGSDMVAIAQKLENLGADYLAVAYEREGVLLREKGVALPILVLHPQMSHLASCIEHCLEPNLYSKRIFEAFVKTANSLHLDHYPVHLKFNTGLNRLGFEQEDISYLSQQLKKTKAIKVQSVLSHLAASEDLDESEFTKGQIRSFEAICTALMPALGYTPIRHLLNTSGVLNYPEAQYEMVRSGIGLYGFGNDQNHDQNLKPVASLKTVISQIHKVEEGASIGYNRGKIATKEMKIATLPIGHADGIGRYLGHGKGKVWIKENCAPIVGNVCMDMIMVEVSEIDCQEGDEVEIFGPNYSASALAEAAGSISYEVLTSLSQRIKRVLIV